MPKYEVKDVVCDYGVFEDDKLILILNSRSNAQLIADILTIDQEHRVVKKYVNGAIEIR